MFSLLFVGNMFGWIFLVPHLKRQNEIKMWNDAENSTNKIKFIYQEIHEKKETLQIF